MSERILCLLSEEQRHNAGADLDRLRRPGIELLFADSPAAALDQIGRLRPRLVLVGMTLDEMEGLEFLARLFKRHADFQGRVVVLPDAGDPFPPMAQFRDASTGKSVTEETSLDQITSFIESLAPSAERPVPAPPAEATKPPARPVPVPRPRLAEAPPIEPESGGDRATHPSEIAEPLAKAEAEPQPLEPSTAVRQVAAVETGPRRFIALLGVFLLLLVLLIVLRALR
jgi:CheY-like chemotaxis protein